MRHLPLLAGLVLALALPPSPAEGRVAAPTRVPLRVDFPAGATRDLAVPVRGGIPFPRGALRDPANVRLLAGGEEMPCQVSRTAVWPNGSVKWVLVDAVLSPAAAGSLVLEHGPDVSRATVPDPLVARARAGGVEVTGPGLAAAVARDGSLAKLVLGGRTIVRPTARLRPVLVARRGEKTVEGTATADSVEVEDAGPLRVRILVRGTIAMPGWGVGYPDRVLAEQPAERVPYSLRIDLVRGAPVVEIAHRIVYTGEPDEDFVVRWGFDLAGQGAGTLRLVRHPGLVEDRDGEAITIVDGPDRRIAWAPTRDGLILVRNGFERRPVALGGPEGDAARVDLWPPEAGPWDLRRDAREWAVGETGDRDRPADMERYARVAAYGVAPSHVVVLDAGGPEERLERARSLAGPALLVAPPGVVARSGALGRFAPEAPDDRCAELDAAVRRYLDWFLFCRELYRWHGKLVDGFWQTRYGEIHRHDRFDRDYGRWGWSLDDGAGRIGELLVLTWLRSGERRYLDAGAAFGRAAYDAAMVHTERHLENARDSWWHVKGCSHRHGVQPFSGPYIGLRGSHPAAQRMLWLLTGDGILGDDLMLVAEAARARATGERPGALGASGGPDGLGSGALACLHAYERTGDRAWLAAGRKLLDASRLIPPAPGARTGYGPSFGLFQAASEYLVLTGDDGFRARFLALADAGAAAKDPTPFLTVLAHATRLREEAADRAAIRRALDAIDVTGTLAELPRDRWPGHGGPRPTPSRANVGRDLPYAFAALADHPPDDRWPSPGPPLPGARVPDDWWRPGGHPSRGDRALPAERLLRTKASRRDGAIASGDARLVVRDGVPAIPGVGEIGRPGEDGRYGVVSGRIDGAGRRWAARVEPERIAGVAGFRVHVAAEGAGIEAGEPVALAISLALSTRPEAIQLHAAGTFRLERWRVDMNDEVIPQWRNSDSRTRWPIWRGGGLVLGNGDTYRIFRRNRDDTAPLFVDEGFGSPGWLDVTDRGGEAAWGLTVRLLRDPDDPVDDVARAVVFDHERRELRVTFDPPPGEARRSFAFDLVVHDGWRPPLAPPDLTREQYARFLADLDDGGNHGLFALRHLLSETHQVDRSIDWAARLAARGIEPRELLLGMAWRDALRRHCERLGVRWDPDRPDASVRAVIERYRRR